MSSVTLNGLMQMLRHAEKLGVFELSWVRNAIINEYEYNTMLAAIQNRSERIGLRMKISGFNVHVKVPEEILFESRSILSIECKSILADETADDLD